MNLGVIGSGRVGSALGEALVAKGFTVSFYDIVESQLEPLKAKGYETTTEIANIAEKADVLFVAVPTESLPNGDTDLSAMRDVLGRLRSFERIFVQVSTCPPGTARELSSMLPGAKYVVHPSFYSMARMKFDALHPVNVLLGSSDGEPVQSITSIFRRFDGPMFWGPWEEVELLKYADNALSATMITYWNQIFVVAEKMGYDVDRIARIVDRDPQYRSGYRFAGQAYSGICLPKDTLSLRNFARRLGVENGLLSAVHDFNVMMKEKYGENQKHLEYRP